MDKTINVQDIERVCRFLRATEGTTFTWKRLEEIFNCKLSYTTRNFIKRGLKVDGYVVNETYYEYPHGWQGEEITEPAIGFSLDNPKNLCYSLDYSEDNKGRPLKDYKKLAELLGLI